MRWRNSWSGRGAASRGTSNTWKPGRRSGNEKSGRRPLFRGALGPRLRRDGEAQPSRRHSRAGGNPGLPGRDQASTLGVLLLVVLDPVEHFLLRRFRAFPAQHLDPLARLQVLVVLEEVGD